MAHCSRLVPSSDTSAWRATSPLEHRSVPTSGNAGGGERVLKHGREVVLRHLIPRELPELVALGGKRGVVNAVVVPSVVSHPLIRHSVMSKDGHGTLRQPAQHAHLATTA